jgi:hypothetical protein
LRLPHETDLRANV